MTCKGHLRIFLSSIEGAKSYGQRETGYPFNLHFPVHLRSSVGSGIAGIGRGEGVHRRVLRATRLERSNGDVT